jgi:hypothetical protein
MASSNLRRWPTEATQILASQLPQDRSVDVIVAESRGVLFESQPVQPRRYVHVPIPGSEERHRGQG